MEKRARVRRRFDPAERERLLAAYHESELTQHEFALRHGLSVSCLSVWLRRSQLARASAPVPFIQLAGGLPMGSTARAPYTIQFPSGLSLEVARGFNREELVQLCEVMRGL